MNDVCTHSIHEILRVRNHYQNPLVSVKQYKSMGHIALLRNSSNLSTHLCKAMIIPTHWLRERKKCYLLFENWTVLICNNLNPLYSRILCAKIGWNWFKWKCEKIVTTLWNISIRKVFRSDELKSLIVKSFFYQIRHEWNIANISIQFMFPFFNFNLQKVGKWLRKNFNRTPLTVILKMP